jgi:hypothetical protein
MSFSLGTLVDYVEQNEQMLVSASVLGPKTAQLIQAQGQVLIGVKSSETINIMSTDANFQADGCGYTASGSTSITQRTVTVGKMKVTESICPKNLEAYYLQKALPAGSSYDTVAFAEQWTAMKSEKIASQLESAIWKGDTTSGNANLNKFDGLIELIKDASTSIVNANSVAFYGSVETAINNSTVVAVFDAVYKAIPAEVVDKDDLKIFCGMDTFRTYTIKLKNDDLFHYQTQAAPNTSFFLPGTAIEVVGTPGLNGTNKIYAMRVSNLYLGTDILDEAESRFKVWYSIDNDEVRYMSSFKLGINFAFPTEIVKFEV